MPGAAFGFIFKSRLLPCRSAGLLRAIPSSASVFRPASMKVTRCPAAALSTALSTIPQTTRAIRSPLRASGAETSESFVDKFISQPVWVRHECTVIRKPLCQGEPGHPRLEGGKVRLVALDMDTSECIPGLLGADDQPIAPIKLGHEIPQLDGMRDVGENEGE